MRELRRVGISAEVVEKNADGTFAVRVQGARHTVRVPALTGESDYQPEQTTALLYVNANQQAPLLPANQRGPIKQELSETTPPEVTAEPLWGIYGQNPTRSYVATDATPADVAPGPPTTIRSASDVTTWIRIDNQKRIWFASRDSNNTTFPHLYSLRVIDAAGTLLKTILLPAGLPVAATIDAQGNCIIVMWQDEDDFISDDGIEADTNYRLVRITFDGGLIWNVRVNMFTQGRANGSPVVKGSSVLVSALNLSTFQDGWMEFALSDGAFLNFRSFASDIPFPFAEVIGWNDFQNEHFPTWNGSEANLDHFYFTDKGVIVPRYLRDSKIEGRNLSTGTRKWVIGDDSTTDLQKNFFIVGGSKNRVFSWFSLHRKLAPFNMQRPLSSPDSEMIKAIFAAENINGIATGFLQSRWIDFLSDPTSPGGAGNGVLCDTLIKQVYSGVSAAATAQAMKDQTTGPGQGHINCRAALQAIIDGPPFRKGALVSGVPTEGAEVVQSNFFDQATQGFMTIDADNGLVLGTKPSPFGDKTIETAFFETSSTLYFSGSFNGVIAVDISVASGDPTPTVFLGKIPTGSSGIILTPMDDDIGARQKALISIVMAGGINGFSSNAASFQTPIFQPTAILSLSPFNLKPISRSSGTNRYRFYFRIATAATKGTLKSNQFPTNQYCACEDDTIYFLPATPRKNSTSGILGSVPDTNGRPQIVKAFNALTWTEKWSTQLSDLAIGPSAGNFVSNPIVNGDFLYFVMSGAGTTGLNLWKLDKRTGSVVAVVSFDGPTLGPFASPNNSGLRDFISDIVMADGKIFWNSRPRTIAFRNVTINGNVYNIAVAQAATNKIIKVV